jgi:MFS family permease
VRRMDALRAIRALPKERRRELTRAVRAGRAVADPRDRALAADWAHTFTDAWWPRWLLPREPPRGKAKALWLLHGAWVLATVVLVAVGAASSLHGPWRWIVLALLIYGLVAIPPLLWFTLRVRWNAPEAARRNS